MNFVLIVKDYKRFTYESYGPIPESLINKTIDDYCKKYYQESYPTERIYDLNGNIYNVKITIRETLQQTYAVKTVKITSPGLFYGTRTCEKTENVCRFRAIAINHPSVLHPDKLSTENDLESFIITRTSQEDRSQPTAILGSKIQDDYEQSVIIMPTVYLTNPIKQKAPQTNETLLIQITNFDKRRLRKAPICPPRDTFNIRHKVTN